MDNIKEVGFVLPPLLSQHPRPECDDRLKQQAYPSEGSCAYQTPRTLNTC